MALRPNHPKNQHYVPQFLLRNFADEDGQLHVFNKAEDRPFKTLPRGIAAEAWFYDFTDITGKPNTAEYVLGILEGTVSHILGGILERGSIGHLSATDRKNLAQFAAVQQLRVKAERQRIKSLNEGILRVLDERGIDPGDVVPRLNDGDVQHGAIAQIRQAIPNAKILMGKAWILQQSPENAPFWISDNPVVLFNRLNQRHLTLESPGISIYLPVSSKFSLCFLCPSWIAPGRVITDDEKRLANAARTGSPYMLLPENVKDQNSLQVQCSSTFVISSVDDFSLARQMIEKNPGLKEPPGFTVS
jgi:hypothetical protein